MTKINKKSIAQKGLFTTAVVGAMIATPYVAEQVDTLAGTDLGDTIDDVLSIDVAHAYEGGTGTATDPYLVSSGDDLRQIINSPSAHYKLINNIDLGNVLWTPIGTKSTDAFTGVLDGNGYEISNLNISSSTKYAGIFGYAKDATIKNLTINHANVSASLTSSNVGTIVAYGTKMQIHDVHVKDATVSATGSSSSVGGVLGDITLANKGLDMSNVTFQGNVSNSTGTYTGGVAAELEGGTVRNISAMGTATSSKASTGTYTGGLFGKSISIKATNLVSDVDVIGYSNVGGLVGGSSNDTFVRGIAYGSVKGLNALKSTDIGGVVGNSASTSKYRLLYAFNSYVGDGINTSTGKIVGEENEDVNFFANSYNVVPGDNHSINVGDVIDDSEIYKKSTYELFGFDFTNEWEMTEGSSAPVLKIQTATEKLTPAAKDVEKYSFAGGSGTIADPYLVSTVEDIQLMAKNPTSHFKLINNIDLEWTLLTPIGTSRVPFTGSFDGNGYKLSNLNVNTVADYTGLFGSMENGFVKNVTIENASVVSTKNYTGIVAGKAENVTFTNIRIIGDDVTVTGKDYTGGLVGYYKNSGSKKYERRYSEGIEVHGVVTGEEYTGGVIGYAKGSDDENGYSGSFDSVSAHANVTGTDYVGGVAGFLWGPGLENVIAYGDVVGDNYVGGIGNLPRVVVPAKTGEYREHQIYYKQPSFINNAIAYGSVSGTSPTKSKGIGGIVGVGNAGKMNTVIAYNSYVGNGLVGYMYNSVGSDAFGRSASSKQYKNIYQFNTILGDAGVGYVDTIVQDNQVTSKAFYENKTAFDFGGTWTMTEGQHPTLTFAPYTADHTFSDEEQTGSQFAGGSGSVEDPFLVSTPQHLDMMKVNPTAHFKLVNDIDLDNAAWTTPIGATTKVPFSGSLDGNGYAIENLNISGTDSYAGLFGYVSETGVIKNLVIDGAYATSTDTYLGILSGSNSGRVENVQIFNAEMDVTKDYAGFIAAKFDGDFDDTTGEGVIKNVYVEGTINGGGKADYLGGVAGNFSGKANVDSVVSKVNVTNGLLRLGGFAGAIASTGTYKNIITTGNIQGDQYLGGFTGSTGGKSTLENIFTYGSVTGMDSGSVSIGGAIGSPYSTGIIKGLYAYNTSVSVGKDASLGKAFGTVPTSSSFTPQFVNVYESMAGGHSTKVTATTTASNYNVASTYTRNGMTFNDESVWAIDAGGAPYLKAFPEKIVRAGSGWSFSSLISDADLMATATTAIDLAESTLTDEDIQAAQIAINAISKSNRSTFQQRLDGVREYQAATKTVIFAEETLKEGNVNDARTEVNKLKNAGQRNELNTRLDALSQTIVEQNALAKVLEGRVSEVERMKTHELLDAVSLEVEKMIESNVKSGFLKRLDNVASYLETNEEVQASLNTLERNIGASNARTLYKTTTSMVVLASGVMDVDQYTPRLAQAWIDIQIAELYDTDVDAALKAVTNAEKTPTMTNVDKAQLLIDVLPDGIRVKEMLQERLDAVKATFGLSELAKQAVEKAEATLAQADYDAALLSVEKLDAGTEKTDYQNRLKTVLQKIQQAEKVVEAEAAVEHAEDTVQQADVDSARTLVNALLAGTDKTNLTKRLDAVQAKIDAEKTAKEALDKAKSAVSNAEATKTQASVNSARTLVNALPNGDEKTALNERLDVVQAIVDANGAIAKATAAVVTAETTPTQANHDSARTLVNALPDGDEKTALGKRLDAVQKTINDAAELAKATQAVVKAEGSKAQTDIDSARSLVNNLPDGADKNSLNARLDEIQKVVDDEKAANEALAKATQAVEHAEDTIQQSDVDDARTLVNALPNGTDKTNLTNRLNAVQKMIDDVAAIQSLLAEATQAVEHAEDTEQQADVDSAREKVKLLPDGDDKTVLNNRLDAIQTAIDKAKAEADKQKAIENATKAVEHAEDTKTQSDVDDARSLVNNLPDGDDKDNLNKRLDAVQKAINDAKDEAEKQKAIDEATKAVEKAEDTKTQTDVDSAREKVNALPDGDEKTDLTNRLDAVQKAIDDAIADNKALQDAKEAVSKAESTKTQSDVDDAREKVKALDEGADKQDLTNRLDAIQKAIDDAKEKQKAIDDAKGAVEKAEGTQSQDDIDDARKKVNELPDGQDKDDLTKRLDDVQKGIDDKKAQDKAIDDAKKAVEKAEGTQSQDDVDDARTLVNKLPDGDEKTDLTKRLDDVQKAIDKAKSDADKEKAIDDAKKAVEKAEGTKTQADVDDAREKVKVLPDGQDKDDLTKRLDAIQNEIDEKAQLESLVNDAKKAVEKAEGSKAQADIDTAREKVNVLADGTEKDELNARLDAIEKGIKDAQDAEKAQALDAATKAVEKAEGSKVDTDIDSAQKLVTALDSSADKDALQDRLDALKAQIKADKDKEAADEALYKRIKSEVLNINNGVLNYFIQEPQYDETLAKLAGYKEEAKGIENDTKRGEVNELIDGVVDLINTLKAINDGDLTKLDNIPDSVVKDKIKHVKEQADLLADATTKVEKAEATITKADIDSASQAIKKLSDSPEKVALQERLDKVIEQYNANKTIADVEAAVSKAETSPTDFNINNAQTKVNTLEDGTVKDAFQARIDAIKEALFQKAVAEATAAVVTAEEQRKTYYVTQAKKKVTALKDSPEKTALAERIAQLEKDILTQEEYDRLYNAALDAIVKAEASTLEFLLGSADKAVQKVSDNDVRKADLVKRLEALYKAKALREVEAAVVRAESSPSDNTVDKAQSLVNVLDEGDVRDGYQARVDAVMQKLDNERYAAAAKAVVNAEANKTRAMVKDAQAKVDVVKDSERKTALQERLDAILDWITYMENLDGKFQPGDNIVDIASSVKDPTAKNFLLNWATAIDTAERYYSNANSQKPANVKKGIPQSVLDMPQYADLIAELQLRTAVVENARSEYSSLLSARLKTAFSALDAFEKDRTQAKYDAALTSINALKAIEKGEKARNAMTERLNRIEIKK